MRLSVIGLGKLGMPLAAVLARSGFRVTGIDRNEKAVAQLRSGRAPVSEPGLQELLDDLAEPIAATTDLRAAVLASDASFIVVPTPSGSDGAFSAEAVIAVVRDIGAALRQKDTYHLIVVSSTVMPGAMDGVVRHALEEAAGGTTGERFGLCYSPEFIALGSVIHDLRQPDFVLIGESDANAGELLAQICEARCLHPPVVRRMNFANAELAKLALNGMLTARISWANMISEICDRLPDADAAVVTATVGSDSRIGSRYLAPALGYGGPCFPRDNAALAALARSLGVEADFAAAADSVNRRQAGRVVTLIRGIRPTGTVAVLGMAYKAETSVIDDSQGVAVAALLAEAGYRVLIADPEALAPAAALLGPCVEPRTYAECAAIADVLIIAAPWPCFRALQPEMLRREGARVAILDCWRLLPRKQFSPVADVIYLGEASRGRQVQGSLASRHG